MDPNNFPPQGSPPSQQLLGQNSMGMPCPRTTLDAFGNVHCLYPDGSTRVCPPPPQYLLQPTPHQSLALMYGQWVAPTNPLANALAAAVVSPERVCSHSQNDNNGNDSVGSNSDINETIKSSTSNKSCNGNSNSENNTRRDEVNSDVVTSNCKDNVCTVISYDSDVDRDTSNTVDTNNNNHSNENSKGNNSDRNSKIDSRNTKCSEKTSSKCHSTVDSSGSNSNSNSQSEVANSNDRNEAKRQVKSKIAKQANATETTKTQARDTTHDSHKEPQHGNRERPDLLFGKLADKRERKLARLPTVVVQSLLMDIRETTGIELPALRNAKLAPDAPMSYRALARRLKQHPKVDRQRAAAEIRSFLASSYRALASEAGTVRHRRRSWKQLRSIVRRTNALIHSRHELPRPPGWIVAAAASKQRKSPRKRLFPR